MRSILMTAILAATLLLTLAPSPAAAAEMGSADAQAAAVADRAMEALGGAEAWENTRYLHFKFFGARAHWWDKHTGRYRVEWDDREGGGRYVVLADLDDRGGEEPAGRAFKDGQELTGDERNAALEQAYGAWVNDFYWLLMPYKLRDPGVNLRYIGEEEIDGTGYDKLELTFDSVGLTPGDTYFAWINRDTGLMDRWAYVLESFDEHQPPTVWRWQGWTRFGDIMLAPERVQPESGRSLPMADIAVYGELPDAAFTSPEPVAAP